jgi:hypothetical protein
MGFTARFGNRVLHQNHAIVVVYATTHCCRYTDASGHARHDTGLHAKSFLTMRCSPSRGLHYRANRGWCDGNPSAKVVAPRRWTIARVHAPRGRANWFVFSRHIVGLLGATFTDAVHGVRQMGAGRRCPRLMILTGWCPSEVLDLRWLGSICRAADPATAVAPDPRPSARSNAPVLIATSLCSSS